jgi:hypothetical protein
MRYAYPLRTAPEGSFSSVAVVGLTVVSVAPDKDGTVPTTAAYDSPRSLVLAVFLRADAPAVAVLGAMVVVFGGWGWVCLWWWWEVVALVMFGDRLLWLMMLWVGWSLLKSCCQERSP